MLKNFIIIFLLITTGVLGVVSFRLYRISSESNSIVETARYERMVAEQSLLENQQELKKSEIQLETVKGELAKLKINLEKEQALISSLQDQIKSLNTSNVDLENALKALTIKTESNDVEKTL